MPDDRDAEGPDWEALRWLLLPPPAIHHVLSDEVLAELSRRVDRLREAGPPLLEGIQRAIAALGPPRPSGDLTAFAQAATGHGTAFDATVISRTLTDTVSVTDSISVEITRGPDEFVDLEDYFQVALAFSFCLVYAWLTVWRLRGLAPTDELSMAKDVVDWCAGLYGLLLAARHKVE